MPEAGLHWALLWNQPNNTRHGKVRLRRDSENRQLHSQPKGHQCTEEQSPSFHSEIDKKAKILIFLMCYEYYLKAGRPKKRRSLMICVCFVSVQAAARIFSWRVPRWLRFRWSSLQADAWFTQLDCLNWDMNSAFSPIVWFEWSLPISHHKTRQSSFLFVVPPLSMGNQIHCTSPQDSLVLICLELADVFFRTLISPLRQ